MNETLTGKAAADAISVYAGLGALDARFDGRKVARAVRDARARGRLLASVTISRIRTSFAPRPLAPAGSRGRRGFRSQQSSTRRMGRAAPPSDPHLAGGG